MQYLLLFISAVFVNNVVLSQFLGICPFFGVSKKVDTATGMGAAVTFVLAISTMVTYLIQMFVLNPLGLGYLQTIAFILVIAALVIQKEFTFLQSLVYAISIGLGFLLALVVFAGIREQLTKANLPKAMKNVPIAMVSASILAMSFMGFSGIV